MSGIASNSLHQSDEDLISKALLRAGRGNPRLFKEKRTVILCRECDKKAVRDRLCKEHLDEWTRERKEICVGGHCGGYTQDEYVGSPVAYELMIRDYFDDTRDIDRTRPPKVE